MPPSKSKSPPSPPNSKTSFSETILSPLSAIPRKDSINHLLPTLILFLDRACTNPKTGRRKFFRKKVWETLPVKQNCKDWNVRKVTFLALEHMVSRKNLPKRKLWKRNLILQLTNFSTIPNQQECWAVKFNRERSLSSRLSKRKTFQGRELIKIITSSTIQGQSQNHLNLRASWTGFRMKSQLLLLSDCIIWKIAIFRSQKR